MKCSVKLIWDSEATIWYTESDDIPGLVLHAKTFDGLIERVRLVSPDLLEENLNYVGPVHISFEKNNHNRWHSPITNRNITVDGTIPSRHMANEVLKQAGLKKQF